MNTLAMILLFLACANASPFIDSLRQEWETFKTTYHKAYKSDTEENYRLKIFVENNMNIAKHNARYAHGEVTFELGVNRFTDMTTQEVMDTMTGLKIEARKDTVTQSGSSRVKNVYTFDSNVSVPSSFDWTEKNCVTHVKNQESCASCYAFSAVGAIECCNKLKSGKLVSLSEQNIVDCSQAYKNGGCRGGSMTNTFEYVKGNGGIDTEESYPYHAVEERCYYKPEDKGATVTGYKKIKSGDEQALMQAVATQGTLSVGIDANHLSFKHYKFSIYYEPECSSYRLNHGVLLVGYGTENGTDYWIVKNSWGTVWGDKGYIRMARNRQNNCGIAKDASFPLV